MTRIVVDASVAVKWFVPEKLSADACMLLAADYQLLAPDLLWAELGNALWKKHRRRELDHGTARRLLRDFSRVPIEVYATEWWTEPALELAIRQSAAPKLGKVDSVVSMELDVPANANGVLYALGGFGGGLTCYVKDGVLHYEFNQFEVLRTKIQAKGKLPTGKVKLEVESKLVGKVGGPMDITLKVNGAVVGQGQVPTAISLHFTTNESFDIGSDISSPVSLAYFDQAPFAFNGAIGTTKITYPKK